MITAALQPSYPRPGRTARRQARAWWAGWVCLVGSLAAGWAEPAADGHDLMRQFTALHQDQSTTTVEKLDAIRDLAYASIDGASAGDPLGSADLSDRSAENIAQILSLFTSDTTGVYCARTADILALLYRHFGYEAWTLHYGFSGPDLVTHAVTLVRTGDQILVQDAYFNLTYTDEAGAHLDLFALNERLKLHQPPRLRFGPSYFKDMHRTNADLIRRLAANPPTEPSFPFFGRGRPMKVKTMEPSKTVIHAVFDPLAYEASLLRPSHPDHAALIRLQKVGYPPQIIYLLLFPFGLSDGESYKRPTDNQWLVRMLSPVQNCH